MIAQRIEMRSVAPNRRSSEFGCSLCRWAFWSLLLLNVTTTLVQRLFPTQDGPIHLYYADVTMDILRGGGDYAGFYEIRHYLPPYALQTYLLGALHSVLPDLAVEKVCVALYLLFFALAFRYLVRAINPENEVVPLLAFPLALNWPLYMGFYNFCFGLAEVLLIAGFWLRYYGRLGRWRSVGFAALVFALAATHPIALALTFGFLCAHTATVIAFDVRAGENSARPGARIYSAMSSMRAPLGHVAFVALPLLWVLSFSTNSIVVWQPVDLDRFIGLMKARAITPFSNPYYHFAIVMVCAASAYLAGMRFCRRGWLQEAGGQVALLIIGCACAVAYFLTPGRLMGAYFPYRFPIYIVVFLLAFGAGVPVPARVQRFVAVVAAGVALFCIAFQAAAKQRIIAELEPVLGSKPVEGRIRAAIVSSGLSYFEYPNLFDPYMWAGAHYLRRSHAAILNAPWLTSSVMVLKPRAETGCTDRDPFFMASCLQAQNSGEEPEGRPDVLVSVQPPQTAGVLDSVAQIAASLGMVERIHSPRLEIYTRQDLAKSTAVTLHRAGR